MNGEIQKIKISALPEALTVSDSDCFLIVQNRKAKRVKPSLMKGKKGDQGLSAYLGVTATHIVWKLGIDGVWQSLISIASLIGPRGEKPIFKKVNGSLMMKYEGEPDSALVNIFDREELKMKFSDLTPAEKDLLKLHFSDLTDADIAKLQEPATLAAAASKKQNEAIKLTEDARALAEQSRIETEKARVLAERSRSTTESARVLAENARIAEEQKRVDVEDLRDQAEQARALAEQYRSEAESARILAEGSRVKAEDVRVLAENAREAAEKLRVEVEASRATEEKKRATAEGLRSKSEIKRDEAESLRNQAEIVRAPKDTARDTAENERIRKEQGRDDAEKLRVLSETSRKESEAARILEERLRKEAELIRKEAETGRDTAEKRRERNGTQAIRAAEDATKKTIAATTIALDLSAHPMKIMGGIWFEWSVQEQIYKNTGIQAKGDVGSSFKIVGRYDTLDKLKAAVPDGSLVDGVYAVGAVEPFSYYAWLFVDGVWRWDNQGQLRGAEGKSSYDVWTGKPENTGKTVDEYFNWLSPLIDPLTGRWKLQGQDMGVQAKAIDAHVTEKTNSPSTYILHLKSAAGEFDTPNLRGFDVKVTEDEANTPGSYKLKITTVAGVFVTPNLQGRSGSAVIDIDHEPTAADTYYTYNGVQYAYGVGDEVRWYDVDSVEYVLFKCYAITQAGAVWEKQGGGVSLPSDVFLNSPSDLAADAASYIYLKDGYLTGKEK